VQDLEIPGYDLISVGIEDIRRGKESVESLLVSIGAPRLRRLGLAVPDGAHSRYNALIRRLVSYERARECAK
jgi:hypothetical protein